MTRPTKADADKRGYVVSFRVTPEEHADLCAKAAASGILVSEFARIAALNRTLKARTVKAANDPVSFELANELRRVGVNLNQITHMAHSGITHHAILKSLLLKIDGILDSVHRHAASRERD